MKSPYVNELQPNQTVTSVFLVHAKEVRQKKNGDPYLSLILADRTGSLDAKMWENAAEAMDTFETDDPSDPTLVGIAPAWASFDDFTEYAFHVPGDATWYSGLSGKFTSPWGLPSARPRLCGTPIFR